MKTPILLSLLILPSITLAAVKPVKLPVHMDLDMTSAEYAPYLKKLKQKRSDGADDPAITKALAVGKRLSDWLAVENARRNTDQQLRLTSPLTRPSNSIDKPKSYNAKTVAASLKKHEAELPAEMWAVLDGAPFPSTLPLPDADFILLAREVDKTYQTSARYKSLLPYLASYKQAKAYDVRSYYFFLSNGWTAERMKGFAELSKDDQEIVRGHLVGMCLNTGTVLRKCKTYVSQHEKAGTLPDAFTDTYAYSKQVWDSFFFIPDDGKRTDVSFSDPTKMVVPFRTPKEDKFRAYLQDNIEAEWKWGDWKLQMVFTEDAAAHLKFETGVVPHVEGIGGNVIVMDDTQPIEEYESQWTIRHEYGHVIGFPDCYHEFYDDELKAFVSYQLDVKDLMCSRAGDMTERLYLDLKRVYFK